MLVRSYVISGIRPVLAKEWYKEFKGDTKFFVDSKTGNYSMKINLPILDAIRTKIGLISYNFRHRNKLKMNRYKGKHYRV